MPPFGLTVEKGLRVDDAFARLTLAILLLVHKAAVLPASRRAGVLAFLSTFQGLRNDPQRGLSGARSAPTAFRLYAAEQRWSAKGDKRPPLLAVILRVRLERVPQ